MGVLDEMTKGLLDGKREVAGPKLTPVGSEAAGTKPSQVGIPDVPEVFLTNEAVADIARDLRVQAATLIAVAEGLDKWTGASAPTATVDPVAVEKAANKAADEKAAKSKQPKTPEAFAAHLATISADAKAAAFTGPEPAAPTPVVSDEWTCPDHGADNIQYLIARPSGRKYRACLVEDCAESE